MPGASVPDLPGPPGGVMMEPSSLEKHVAAPLVDTPHVNHRPRAVDARASMAASREAVWLANRPQQRGGPPARSSAQLVYQPTAREATAPRSDGTVAWLTPAVMASSGNWAEFHPQQLTLPLVSSAHEWSRPASTAEGVKKQNQASHDDAQRTTTYAVWQEQEHCWQSCSARNASTTLAFVFSVLLPHHTPHLGRRTPGRQAGLPTSR